MNKVTVITIFVTLFAYSNSFAGDIKDNHMLMNARSVISSPDQANTGSMLKIATALRSPADDLYSHSFGVPKQANMQQESGSQFCDSDNTGVITIYSTNGMANKEIDVKVDSASIGSLSTYYADGGPACSTKSAKGIITINVTAGEHFIEASSPNMAWPRHVFTVKKCGCVLIPLS